MNEKIEERGVEVQGIEVIDLGDAAVETKQQSPQPWIQDSCCSWTYFAE
jgi:hypothetical protein